MKVCTTCNTEKEAACFHKRAASKDGLAYLCRVCVAAYNASERHKKAMTIYDASTKGKARTQKYREDYPGRHAARTALSLAVATGKIVRPEFCYAESCDHTGAVEAHHADYTNHLDVVWLCRPCHVRVHSLQRN